MTEYDYYSDFTTDVESELEDVKTKIEEGVSHIWDTWDNAIGSKGWMWFVNPGVKIAFEIAKGKIEDSVEQLWDEFETFVDDIWAKVEDMLGNPWSLMNMNEAYIAAASSIRDEKTVIDNLTFTVGQSWSGDAYDSYVHAAEQQTSAIAAVDDGLSQAATACAEGALQLRSVWRDVIDALLDVVDFILDAIKDGTDAGQWVTFDAGPAIRVIGKCITAALRLWNQLDRYFDENATVKVDMWRQLNSGLDGLDANNDWPAISRNDESTMDDKGGWTPG